MSPEDGIAAAVERGKANIDRAYRQALQALDLPPRPSAAPVVDLYEGCDPEWMDAFVAGLVGNDDAAAAEFVGGRS